MEEAAAVGEMVRVVRCEREVAKWAGAVGMGGWVEMGGACDGGDVVY